MNNTIENDFLITWLYLTHEVDKSVKFHVKCSQDLT